VSDPFDGADFYDVREGETLTHATPWDAIDDHLSDNGEPGETLGAVIDRLAPIEVIAFRSVKVSDYQWFRFAEIAAESVVSEWNDSAEISGGDEDPWTETRTKALADALEPLIRQHAPPPWCCEESGRREYSAADLRAMFASEIEGQNPCQT
jgi:hypothetical protein